MFLGLPKTCAIWIRSPESLSEKNSRCSVMFVNAQKKLQNDSFVKEEKTANDGQSAICIRNRQYL